MPDRPGYGATGGPATGPTGNADAVAAMLAGRGAAPAVVVGHSYGGVIALRLAQRHPAAASALVLVASAGTRSALSWPDRLLGLPLVGEAVAFAGMRGVGHVAHWTARRTRAAGLGRLTRALGMPPERLESHTAAWRSGDTWRSFAVEQRGLIEETPVIEAGLGALDLPVVVVAGRRDVVVPPRAADELAAALPRSELIWLAGGHLLPWQAAAEVADVIARVAADAAPGSASDVDA